MENKSMTTLAKVLSGIFNPFIIPFVAFLLLFLFSYLRVMPVQYKLLVLGIVYCFTVLMPIVTIYLFKRINGWTSEDMNDRKKRFVPYFLTIVAYVFCLVLMLRMKMPYYMTGIILTGLLAIAIGLLLNAKWKVSEHVIGMGAVVGGLVSFGFLFTYNPVWWLCAFILLSGLLGTSRIILGRHTPGQVLISFAVGFCCAIYGILYF